MEEPKQNKVIKPAENKQVRIKMRPNRAAEGVSTDANGYAFVDSRTAERLISIQYADMAEEK